MAVVTQASFWQLALYCKARAVQSWIHDRTCDRGDPDVPGVRRSPLGQRHPKLAGVEVTDDVAASAPIPGPLLDYLIVDVFTPEAGRAYAGNPLAVVLGGDALSTAQCQALAREFNLSETVFPMQPQAAGADYRARIFTPSSELPFAGPPVGRGRLDVAPPRPAACRRGRPGMRRRPGPPADSRRRRTGHALRARSRRCPSRSTRRRCSRPPGWTTPTSAIIRHVSAAPASRSRT